MLVTILVVALYSIVFLICVYAGRHYVFTAHRLFGRQRAPYIDIEEADWPKVTVLIPAHNEEVVIGHCLQSLLQVDYPQGRLHIVVINDRSTDRTGAIIDDYTRLHPGRVTAFHKKNRKPGKAAALKDAMAFVQTEIVLTFDADYLPGKALIKRLVAPFFDPEVGAVMGRVVPMNVNRNLLTGLLDLERAGGYQVDQQARMSMRVVPQFGGTVGGVRTSALESVGGWNDDILAEDTDVTFRLLLHGWKTAYENRSECYEEVPEIWPDRIRQIKRWATGHNQVLARYFIPLMRSRRATLGERVDGLLLLGVYALAPLILVGWMLAITLFYLGVSTLTGVLAILAVTSYVAIGNFAAFFEIAAAARLDHSYKRVRLLPFNLLNFLVSAISVSQAGLAQLFTMNIQPPLIWHKTPRFRKAA